MLILRGVGENDVIANLFPLTRAPHGAFIRVLHAAASGLQSRRVGQLDVKPIRYEGYVPPMYSRVTRASPSSLDAASSSLISPSSIT